MPSILVTGPTAKQNPPFLPLLWPKPSPVLIAQTHEGMARLSGPGRTAGITSWCSSRPTQPGHPFVGLCNEHWRWFRPQLGKKRQILLSSGPC